MADTYIDVFETLIYGRLACQGMRRMVMPLGSQWASAVEWCIRDQEAANATMASIVARLKLPTVNEEELERVSDIIVRFGYWMDSLEGRPLDRFTFFAGEAPSDISSERLPKLTGHLERMINKLAPYAEVPADKRIEGVVGRLGQLREAHAIAERNRVVQHDAQLARKEIGPEAEKARQAWLKSYVANKFVVEGILRHHDKLEWKPLIFDDLAEVQRSREEGGEDLDALVTSPTGGPAPQPESDGEDPTTVG